MTQLSLFAPAKVNLDLTVTGLREDGYHTLRSHVAFADIGDDITLTCEDADKPHVACTISGPFASQLDGLDSDQNLAVRAALLFLQQYNLSHHIHIDLVKNIPSGAGLGGGSSDAATVWRGLNQIFGKNDPAPMSLGADVPVCFHAKPCLMEGVGEIFSPWDIAPKHAILIWPGPAGSTKDLYVDFDAAGHISQDPDGNAFEALAIKRCPAIGDALAALGSLPGCSKAQLSGSGTAVFGVFDRPFEKVPALDFPWVQPCVIGDAMKPLVTVLR